MEKKTQWKAIVESTKEDLFTCYITKTILLRRVPHNYIVVQKKACNRPRYYSKLLDAMEGVVDCMIIDKIKKTSTIEEIKDELKKINKKLDTIVPKLTTYTDGFERSK